MSDPRFASFKTDPRFRRPKKHESKVILDDRFKDLLGNEKKGRKKKNNNSKQGAKVDKYGRTVSETQEKDDLRRFYRLEGEDGEENVARGADGAEPAAVPTVIDYARGAVLMESDDEEEEEAHHPVPEDGSESDEGGFVSLGAETSRRKKLDDEDGLEIDLDENTVAALDAQIAEYAKTVPEQHTAGESKQTRRIAVVNLDWDYVRAAHLYKIFSSLVSATAPLASINTSQTDKSTGTAGVNVVRGKILSVRVYPSEFGKKRMAREEKEGPPIELFKKKNSNTEEEEINEKTIFDTGTDGDYDEDALRKYQLERLRYYYAIVECDTVEAAAHVYNELEGTELERSANVFDLSFVPGDMTFEDEPRDEATELSDAPYRAVEFVTDALRHSKVKLTWDEDDPERTQLLRRPLTKKEIEEADFRAYIASSSESDSDNEKEGDLGQGKGKGVGGRRQKSGGEGKGSKKAAERDKLRMLLLGGNDEDLPEGWGDAFDNKASRGGKGKKEGASGEEESDVDMEVTFTAGLSEAKNPEDENTLERYQRKMKEKRKKRKEEAKKMGGNDEGEGGGKKKVGSAFDDEFFGAESGSDREEEAPSTRPVAKSRKTEKPAEPSTSKATLELLAASDNPHGEPAHFDMKAVLKAEKQSKNKKSRRKKKRGEDDADEGPNETQEDFVIDVKDERFTALHENHQFAIDPSNPHFKKTKSMGVLLEERSKRQKSHSYPTESQSPASQTTRSLQSLVESVKRKSGAAEQKAMGKRRKLSGDS